MYRSVITLYFHRGETEGFSVLEIAGPEETEDAMQTLDPQNVHQNIMLGVIDALAESGIDVTLHGPAKGRYLGKILCPYNLRLRYGMRIYLGLEEVKLYLLIDNPLVLNKIYELSDPDSIPRLLEYLRSVPSQDHSHDRTI